MNRLADVDDQDVAALITADLMALAAQRRQLAAERGAPGDS